MAENRLLQGSSIFHGMFYSTFPIEAWLGEGREGQQRQGRGLLSAHGSDALVKSTLMVYGEKKNVGKQNVSKAGLLLLVNKIALDSFLLFNKTRYITVFQRSRSNRIYRDDI